jgi:RNA polymerase sigma factor (sigma-70 family)
VTDTDLATRAADGDREAFGRLVEAYAPVARRMARALLGNAEDADDAVQDGLLAAWRAIGRYDPDRPFRPWLLRIVLNAARDLGRRRVVRRTEALAPDAVERVPGAGPTPEQAAGRALLREALDRALAALPDRQRVAVTLFDGEGYAHAEIAALLGVPEGTVRSDLFHGRRALRTALRPFQEDTTA